MPTAVAQPFRPPEIPWRQPRPLALPVELGPGLDPHACGQALARLCAEPDVLALVAFGSRARGEARADSDLDLAVILRQPQLTPAEKLAGSADAERLSGSRWHVFGDVAREGKVLDVAV